MDSRQDDYLWGIDLGGTKIEGVVLDRNHRVLDRQRIATEGQAGYEHVLSQIKSLLVRLSDSVNSYPQHVGFGTPGTLDPETGLLRGSNSQHLNDRPLDADLRNLLESKISIENDANCFALAESRMGVVPDVDPDASVVFGVIMGTGVGGGLVVNDKLITGRNKIAGEWGHNFLHNSGGLCYCGKRGCVETVISGPAIERYYEHQSGNILDLDKIVKLAQSGDELAVKTMGRLCHYFGKGIANLINVLDPDVIVIGGGVGNVPMLYTQGIKKVREFVFTPRLHTKIVKPKLGDSAGVFGAAFLTETLPQN